MHLDVFQALADPTRRRIVETLLAGELQVADVVAKAGIHQSGVSRHLRILYDSGFVLMRPDGQRRFYALRPAPFRQLDGWLTPYRELWEARLDRFGAALEDRASNAAPKKPRKGKSDHEHTRRSASRDRGYRAELPR
jgi:DNA-binding transcriptional ArsR family regulator